MTIDKIETHKADAIARLPRYLKDATELHKLLGIYPDRAQELEEVLFDVLDKRTLGESVGEQLNVLGRIVGEPRLGRNDADYEDAIGVRILVITSRGDKGRLRKIAKQWAGADRVTTTDAFPAALILTILGGTITDPDRLARALDEAKLGGVGLFPVAALQDPPFAFSGLIASATDGATVDADTFSVSHSLADALDGDKLRIYAPDVDAGLFTISDIGASTFDVSPGTLTAPRSGISYDIRRHRADTGGFSGLLSVGTNGATTAPDILDSAGATFQSDGVDATSKIFVVGFGLFAVDSVPLETRILSAELLAAVGAGATALEYYVVDPTTAGFLAALLN